MQNIDLRKEINELKSQFSYSKNIGFFFGAGTSCALGLPNVETLTVEVRKKINADCKALFDIVKNSLSAIYPNKKITIEDILNYIRQIRELTCERSDKMYEGINGAKAKELDLQICKSIYLIISEKENSADTKITERFLAWLNILNNNFSKEIYTPNYDLIFEKSLEKAKIPYFDGFVGSYEPFFLQESVDVFVEKKDLTNEWLRLWKIHGSLNWTWKKDYSTEVYRIIRNGKFKSIEEVDNELVIYPSKEKYSLSRKQPFLSYFDRMKKYLSNGELLFVFSGYSFSDQHINDIILDCLRRNNRLFALVFSYTDESVEKIYPLISSHLNINVFGPKKAIINGEKGEWSIDENTMQEEDEIFWDNDKKTFKLGDFNSFVGFVIESSGKKQMIEEILNEK